MYYFCELISSWVSKRPMTSKVPLVYPKIISPKTTSLIMQVVFLEKLCALSHLPSSGDRKSDCFFCWSGQGSRSKKFHRSQHYLWHSLIMSHSAETDLIPFFFISLYRGMNRWCDETDKHSSSTDKICARNDEIVVPKKVSKHTELLSREHNSI